MEVDELSHKQWLSENDVSRPHRAGRWRVRFVDTRCAEFPYFLEVGGFFSETPTRSDYEHFCKWRDSGERRHKQNAAGFLRFAKYRRLIDGSGENQVARVKEMCANIRTAMFAFAHGNNDAGESAMKDAWGSYMILAVLSTHSLVLKGVGFAPGRRKGAVGKFRTLVENAYSEIGRKNLKDVIKHLEKNDEHVEEVDWVSGEIWIAGELKARKFKTIQNILSRL